MILPTTPAKILEACKVNYHHNFCVQENKRIYYNDAIPDVVQVGEHQFVECCVIELWINSIVVSWTSAMNCARLYNATLSGNKPPPGWQFGFTLKSDHVWNGFVILCLLEDLHAQEQTLVVQHKDIEDKDRYKEAMRVRNRRLRLYSQPELLHYCNKCTRFFDNGKNSL